MKRIKSAPLELSLKVRPEWPQAAELRAIVASLVRVALADDEAASNAGMVACELAENAIKYGDWSRPDTFDVRLRVGEGAVTLEVVSPCSLESGRVERLQRILRDIAETSPKAAYLKRVADVAELTGESGRLGLLRIAHEVGSRITAEERDGRLAVTAHWTFEENGSSRRTS